MENGKGVLRQEYSEERKKIRVKVSPVSKGKNGSRYHRRILNK
jgi:hypothetical protein